MAYIEIDQETYDLLPCMSDWPNIAANRELWRLKGKAVEDKGNAKNAGKLLQFVRIEKA